MYFKFVNQYSQKGLRNANFRTEFGRSSPSHLLEVSMWESTLGSRFKTDTQITLIQGPQQSYWLGQQQSHLQMPPRAHKPKR